MTQVADDLLATRCSLLERLKDADDQGGWQRFFDSYAKLLYRVALQSGLREAEAQDAVQETVIAVAKHMPEFQYDPARCSFKSWLMLIMRQRIVHQFRKRQKPGGEANRAHLAHAQSPGRAAFDSSNPATVDTLPETVTPPLEAIWNEEWHKHVTTVALHEVKRQVTDRQFQIFDLYVLQEWPVQDVARTLRLSATQVYLAKHRVGRLLKKELRRLEQELK